MEQNKQKGSRKQLQLTSLKNYVIFLTLTVGVVNLTVLAFSWWTVGLAFIWGVRLISGKQLKLALSCFFVALLASGFFWHCRLKEEAALTNRKAAATRIQLDVLPHTFVLSGDYLRLDGWRPETNQRYRLHYKLSDEGEKQAFAELTRLSEVDVEIDLKEPPSQRNLNGFDYHNYLVQEGIYFYGEIVTIHHWQAKQRPSLRGLVTQGRSRLHQSFLKRLPSPLGSQLSNLVLGVKDELLKEQQRDLSALGVNQLLSLSGLQLIYFSRLFSYVLRRIGVTLEAVWLAQLVLCGVLLIFYWGTSLSLFHSLIALSYRTLQSHQRWSFSRLDSWALAVMTTLFIRPYALFQVGGQLSFCLTFYWLYLAKPGHASTSSRLLKVALSGVLAIPLIAFHFYRWHFLSLALSWLLLPVYVYLIWPALTVTWLSTFVLPVVVWADGLNQVITGLTTMLVKLGQVNFFTHVSGTLPWPLVVLTLIVSLLFLAGYSAHHKSSWLYFLLLLSIPFGFKYLNPQGLIAFVDVGQGESTFIQLPFQQGTMLIDTGGRLSFPQEAWAQRQSQPSNGALTLLPFLQSRGVTQLDYVFLSHADVDHIGDLAEVGQLIQIKEVIFPLGMDSEPAFAQVLAQLEAGGTVGRGVLRGVSWRMGPLVVQSLAPSQAGLGTNEDSLVLRFAIKGTSFLQMGDLDAAGEAELLETYPSLRHDVLNAGHHGSRTSSTSPFLAAVRPQVGIVSVGQHNRYGHPHPEVLTNFADLAIPLYRTDQRGMIYYTWWPWSAHLSEIQTIH